MFSFYILLKINQCQHVCVWRGGGRRGDAGGEREEKILLCFPFSLSKWGNTVTPESLTAQKVLVTSRTHI